MSLICNKYIQKYVNDNSFNKVAILSYATVSIWNSRIIKDIYPLSLS